MTAGLLGRTTGEHWWTAAPVRLRQRYTGQTPAYEADFERTSLTVQLPETPKSPALILIITSPVEGMAIIRPAGGIV